MKQVKPCPFECNANDCKDCGAYTYSHHTQTNDEWRKTCSTEEFAEFLNFIAFDWNRVDKQWVLEWLKQPHAPQKQDDYPCNVKGCTMETRQSCCGCPDYFEWEKQNKG